MLALDAFQTPVLTVNYAMREMNNIVLEVKAFILITTKKDILISVEIQMRKPTVVIQDQMCFMNTL
jgi:hypothetical protein